MELTRSVDSDTEDFLSYLSRSEATAITRMMDRPIPSAPTLHSPLPRHTGGIIRDEFILQPRPAPSAPTITPAVPRQITEINRNEFILPIRPVSVIRREDPVNDFRKFSRFTPVLYKY